MIRFVKHIDIVLFIILLMSDMENIINYIFGKDTNSIFSLIFNLWFLLLVVIIFRYFIFKDRSLKIILKDFFL